jgi:hypothetical protein
VPAIERASQQSEARSLYLTDRRRAAGRLSITRAAQQFCHSQ